MYEVVGTLLPLALAVSLSPIPVIATILMLLSPNARASALLFLFGWVLGTLVVVTVFSLVAEYLPHSEPGASNPVAAVVQIVLGLALLLLAVGKRRRGRATDDPPRLPSWMSSMTTATPGRAALLGLSLSSVNPKNLLIAAAAGVAIGTAGLGVAAEITAIAIYTLVASVTIVVPVVAFLISATRMTAPLSALSTWLERNSATIMGLLLVIFGVLLIGNGIGDLGSA